MKALDCKTFRERIFDFQADELGEAEREAQIEHAARCESCARRLQTEESFARFLRTRLRRETAAPALRARVREALRREAPERPPGLGSLFRRPAVGVAAAALALALLLGPALLSTPAGAPAAGQVVRVVRTATVVDLQCDRLGRSMSEQIRCRHPRHFNALKVADGQYWTLSLGQEGVRDLVLDPGRRGRRLIVRGDFYPALSTLRVAEIREADPVSL